MDLPLYAKEIWLFKEAIDFRKGKASLIGHILKENKPPNEGLYLFINKRKDKIKGLCWHKNGFLLLWKELEKGKFSFELGTSKTSLSVSIEELTWLLAGLPWQRMKLWGIIWHQYFFKPMGSKPMGSNQWGQTRLVYF